MAEERVPILPMLRYFARLGTIGFGGPIALAGYMERDLVEERGWISAEDYRQGLALAQLAPGPLAAQLAMYLGWVRARALGAIAVGVAFIAPSLFMVMALSALYVRFGGLPWMRGVFYGIGAAVIAIIARSGVKLARMSAGRDRLLWSVVAVNAFVTAYAQSEMIWLFVASGAFVFVVRAAPGSPARRRSALAVLPAWLVGGLQGTASLPLLLSLLWFFAKAGTVVFGSGLAVVPFLYGGVVHDNHWLTERQFLDAVAVSMITPGPVVITVAFIGYLVAGPAGGIVAAAGVFLPVLLVVILVAPHFRKLASNKRLRAFIDGLIAAATGAILGAVVVLARRALVDVVTIAIAAATFVIVWRVRRIPEPVVVAVAGLVGLLLFSPTTAHAQELRFVRDVPLPAPASRFDYQSIDPAKRRLYISHMDAGRMVVFDLDSAKVVGEVTGLDRCTGVLAVPEEHAVYVSAAGRHALAVVDERSLRIVATAGGIRFPDGIAYAPAERKVFVSDESGGVDAVIDARTNMKRSAIALGGEAGNTHYDSVTHRILVAVQTRNELVAIDPGTERIMDRWPVPGVEGPHGFTMDQVNRLAFVSGEGNAQLAVIDMRTMRVLARHRVGDDPDVLAWDPGLRRLYVASESGVVSIFGEEGTALRRVGEIRLPHAHTISVDPRTHRVYLPLENLDGRPVLRIMEP